MQREEIITFLVKQACERYRDDGIVFQNWIKEILNNKTDKELKELYDREANARDS